jgi:hypothetical protein
MRFLFMTGLTISLLELLTNHRSIYDFGFEFAEILRIGTVHSAYILRIHTISVRIISWIYVILRIRESAKFHSAYYQ